MNLVRLMLVIQLGPRPSSEPPPKDLPNNFHFVVFILIILEEDYFIVGLFVEFSRIVLLLQSIGSDLQDLL